MVVRPQSTINAIKYVGSGIGCGFMPDAVAAHETFFDQAKGKLKSNFGFCHNLTSFT